MWALNHDPTVVFTVAPEDSRMEAPWNDPTLNGGVPMSHLGLVNSLM